MLNINETKIQNINNEGIYEIHLQGCSHRCHQCNEEEINKFIKKINISVRDVLTLIETEGSRIKCVCFTGGEPIAQARELSRLAQLIKDNTNHHIICSTNYSLDEINSMEDEDVIRLMGSVDTLHVSACNDSIDTCDKIIDDKTKITLVNKKLYPVSDFNEVYIEDSNK